MNMPVHTDSSSVWDTLPHVVSRTQFCQYSYLFSKHRALHFIPEFTFIIALGKTSSFFRKMFLKFLLRYDSLTTELTVLFTYLLAVLGLHCCVGFSLLGWAGATLHCSAWASHCGGFSCCRAQAPGTQAIAVAARGLRVWGSQALEHRLSGCAAWAFVALQHVVSSWIRVRTLVFCFGRQILYHWATREALNSLF